MSSSAAHTRLDAVAQVSRQALALAAAVLRREAARAAVEARRALAVIHPLHGPMLVRTSVGGDDTRSGVDRGFLGRRVSEAFGHPEQDEAALVALADLVEAVPQIIAEAREREAAAKQHDRAVRQANVVGEAFAQLSAQPWWRERPHSLVRALGRIAASADLREPTLAADVVREAASTDAGKSLRDVDVTLRVRVEATSKTAAAREVAALGFEAFERMTVRAVSVVRADYAPEKSHA